MNLSSHPRTKYPQTTASSRPTHPITFSQTVLEAHGIDPQKSIAIGCQNFTVGPSNEGGTPFAPVCDPNGDAYLGWLGVPSSGAGDIVLCLTLLPGLEEYYRSVGLLDPTTKVVQVDPIFTDRTPGFPASDPLSLIQNDEEAKKRISEILSSQEGKTPYLVGTFMTPFQRKQAENLGALTVQTSDPRETSNKSGFRHSSSIFGYNVTQGLIVTEESNFSDGAMLMVSTLVQRLKDNSHQGDSSLTGAWMKLSHGSGGDFVQPLDIPVEVVSFIKKLIDEDNSLSVDDILNLKGNDEFDAHIRDLTKIVKDSFRKLRESLVTAFTVNDYGENALSKFWPETSFTPYDNQSSVIIEQDVRANGTVTFNASNFVRIESDGSYEILGWFKQLTDSEGNYMGSAKFAPEDSLTPEENGDLLLQIDEVVSYAHVAGLTGFLGVDFFSVETPSGKHEHYMTELNGRIPISGTAYIIAEKANAPSWINVNMETQIPICHIDNFLEIFGEYAYQAGDDLSSGPKVIPQAFRTFQSSTAQLPSCGFKALIVGGTQQECEVLLNTLKKDGIIK